MRVDILPESIKELFEHVTSTVDAAKPTEKHMELAQMAIRGVLDLSDTKEANKGRISDSVAQNVEIKKIALKCAELLDQLRGNSNKK